MFVQEARGRLDTLTDALLEVESADAHTGGEALDRILRETHSLKGSAAMVGFPEIGRVAHDMEESVSRVRRGDDRLTTDLVDGLLAAVDRIRSLLGAGEADSPAAQPTSAGRTATHADLRAGNPRPAAMPDDAALPERLGVDLARLDDMVHLSGDVRSGLFRLRTLLGAKQTDAEIDVLRDLERTGRALQHRIAAARTVPVSTTATRLRRAVRDAARSRQVEVRWAVVGGHIEIDGTVIRGVEDALLHLVRNSVAHGIEPPDVRRAAGKNPEGEIRLRATSGRGRVQLTVSDDGRGLDRDLLLERAHERGLAVDETDWTALVFRAGLSTAADVDHLAGRGVGMDVVAAAVRAVRGVVTVETAAGVGTSITLDLPTSLAVTRCVVVTAGAGRYGIPADDVAVVLGASLTTEAAGGHLVVRHGAMTAPLVDLAVLFGGDPTPDGPTLVVESAGRTVALRVAKVLRQADVTVQSRLPGAPRTSWCWAPPSPVTEQPWWSLTPSVWSASPAPPRGSGHVPQPPPSTCSWSTTPWRSASCSAPCWSAPVTASPRPGTAGRPLPPSPLTCPTSSSPTSRCPAWTASP